MTDELRAAMERFSSRKLSSGKPYPGIEILADAHTLARAFKDDHTPERDQLRREMKAQLDKLVECSEYGYLEISVNDARQLIALLTEPQ